MAVLAAVALGGCAGEEPPRIALGPAGPATPVAAAGEPDGAGLLPIADWPAACDLLPEPAVREILPSATVVRMERTMPVSTGSVLPDDAACRIGIDFAGVKRPAAGAYPAFIHVTIRVAGTPEAARRGYSGAGDDCPPELVRVAGLDDCGRDDAGWTFLKGGVAGELSGVAPVLNNKVRYAGQDATVPADRIWRDIVETEMLKAVSARLPG